MTTHEDLSLRLEKARQNAQILRSRIERRKGELEAVQKTVNDCRRQAEQLGVTTPEELRALIEKAQAEDLRAIEAVETGIREAATVLQGIEQQIQTEGH
jgi:hypothetical protein